MLLMLVAFIWYKYFPQLLTVDPANLAFYSGNGRIWTIVSAIFVHAGWLHLLGNLVYFNVFGPILESRVGHGMFLFYFLVMGVFGNLVHGMVASLGWFGQYGVGVLGASGAIAGLLAFSLIRFHNAKVEIAWWVFAPLMGQNRAGRSKIALQLAVGLWLMMQVIHALVATQTGAAISYGAHFGGFFMGLTLALFMGQWREGHQEGIRDKAAEYFRDGAFHASVGLWHEYLALVPADLNARMNLARGQVLCDQTAQAEMNYRRVFHRQVRNGEIGQALEVFREADRAGLVSSFSPVDMAKVAYFQEKQLDYTGAIRTHEQLYQLFPHRNEGHRSLVRLIMLHKMKVIDPGRMGHWIAVAHQKLPHGGWRNFLDEEFRTEGGLSAIGEQDPLADFSESLSGVPSQPGP